MMMPEIQKHLLKPPLDFIMQTLSRENNYYRFVLIIDGIEQDGVFIDNDELQDGEIKNLLLANYSERRFCNRVTSNP